MANANEQTNLFVFLTPQVMAAPEEAAEFYEDQKDKLRHVPEKSIKLYGSPLNQTPEETE
jgi:type II secretory pathway component GspD/PulD (secretin)